MPGDSWRWQATSHRVPQAGYRVDVIDNPAAKPREQPYGFAPPQPKPPAFAPQIRARQRI